MKLSEHSKHNKNSKLEIVVHKVKLIPNSNEQLKNTKLTKGGMTVSTENHFELYFAHFLPAIGNIRWYFNFHARETKIQLKS